MLDTSGRRTFVKVMLAAFLTPVALAMKAFGGRRGEKVAMLSGLAPPPPTPTPLATPRAPQALVAAPPISANLDFFRNEHVRALIARQGMLRGLDVLLYEHIRSAVQAVIPTTPIYNPYLYESLLSDVARLLDRCLAYRRECADLEAHAVRQALEFQLFDDLYPMQEQLQNLLTGTGAIDDQRAACASASNAFDASSAGFKALYGGTAVALATQKGVEDTKRVTLAAILARAKHHQELLKRRHTTPGHSLHYAERRERVVAFVKQDIVEAYQKARAARAGLAAQLGVSADNDYPFPVFAGNDTDVLFLDRFVLWARSVAQRYEIVGLEETAFDRVIPLVFPWTAELGGGNPRSLITQDAFDGAMRGDGRLSFTLRDQLPTESQVKHLRIRSVGLSIGVGQDFWTLFPHFTSRTWSCSALVPEQRDPRYDDPAIRLKRGTVVLGRVGLYRADVIPEMYSGAGVWNADPRGDWVIVVDRAVNLPYNVLDANAGGWPRGGSYLKDIKLHLRLVGEPSRQPSDWVQSPP